MEDKFNNREVIVLIEELRSEFRVTFEELRSDFRAVAEVVVPLREDMQEVKERLSKVEFEVRTLKDAIRITLPNHEKRITRLEDKVGVERN